MGNMWPVVAPQTAVPNKYFNCKGFYSIVLMALVYADYKFIWADVGGTGSASDTITPH